MSIARLATAVAVAAALGGGFVTPAQAYHICVSAPDAPDVCICPVITDHHCFPPTED